jgi:hypothetical protein
VGAAAAITAMSRFPSVSDFAMRALIQMALTSLDRDDPPRYFGGWEATARALGRDVPELADELTGDERREVERQRENARRAVGRAVKELVAAGAVSRTNRPKVGSRAVYHLNLWTT